MPNKPPKQVVDDQQALTKILRRLDELDQNVVHGFKSVDTQFEQVDKRLDRVDQRLDGVDQRLDRVDQRLEQVDQRLDRMDKRFDNHDARFENIDSSIAKLDQRITQVDDQIRSDIKKEIKGVLKMLPEIGDDLLQRITRVHEEFTAFRDVSLMTWAELKRHLLREHDEHEKIKQDAQEFQTGMQELQQKSDAHERRISKLEAGQNAPT